MNFKEIKDALNANLHKAKAIKNDEFYTRIDDIGKEVQNYKGFFNGKVVYCNCDTPNSNFFKFFSQNFHNLGLKGLMTSGYNGGGHGIASTFDGDGEPKVYELDGDGGYGTPESRNLLAKCDIVVTNPPFSLFRDFMKIVMDSGKRCLILGSMTGITYKEVFPYFKSNKLWLGCRGQGNMLFTVPEENKAELLTKKEGSAWIRRDNEVLVALRNIVWYTNLDNQVRHSTIPQTYVFSGHEDLYPKYDNFDAIEVGRVGMIPKDYPGVMGVPITLMYKFNPNQFELIGHAHDVNGNGGPGAKGGAFTVNGKQMF